MNRITRRATLRIMLAIGLIAFLGASLLILPSGLTEAQAPDYDLPAAGGAHFYTQTNGGQAGTGFAVSNADGIPFWNFFQSVGGVQAVGYPVSHRFIWNGFTVQAFQKVVFQWRPEAQTVYYVNVLDEMHNAGLDAYLQNLRQVPPIADWSADAGLPFDQVQARHLALLQANAAIAAAYNAEPDTLNRNGLPMAPIQNMGNVLVLRTQRKVYQQWLVNVPWAQSGQVVVANGGDLGKEAGIYPTVAVQPQPAASVPLGVVSAPTPRPGPTPTPVPAGPCNGDEQIAFNPPNPQVNQVVNIAVTSARASSNVALNGPYNPNYVGVHPVGSHTEWDWLIHPTQPGRLDYTFTINGVVCTANFVVVGGSAPTPTPTTSPAPATPTPNPLVNMGCPTNFPARVTPQNPAAGEEFTIELEGPSREFGLQTLVGEGVIAVTEPTTNPGVLRARVLVEEPGAYTYTYIINGQQCQLLSIHVGPRLLR